MLYFFLFLLFIFFSIIFIFSNQKLSPIPYFPSNKKDMNLIIKSLKLRSGQTIVDLGAGDGIIIFNVAKEASSKKLNMKLVALETNPILLIILFTKRLFFLYKKNIKIIYADIFKADYKKIIDKKNSSLTFYLYISPWFTDKIGKKIRKSFPKASIVSYMYPIKFLKKKELILQGLNKIYCYH